MYVTITALVSKYAHTKAVDEVYMARAHTIVQQRETRWPGL